VVESRFEGLVLLTVDEAQRCPVTVDWPTAATGSWVALLAADLAGRAGVRSDDSGVVTLDTTTVDDVIDDLIGWRGSMFNQALKDNPAATRAEAERQLTHLGLLRVTADDSWQLSPVAARYRDPDVLLPDTPTVRDTPTDPDQEPLA
jgi:hypothetical protein